MASTFDLLLVLMTLGAVAVPSQMLLLDVLGKLPAPKALRFIGVPAFVAFIVLLLFFATTHSVLFGAVTLGIAAGILATLALDSIRVFRVVDALADSHAGEEIRKRTGSAFSRSPSMRGAWE